LTVFVEYISELRVLDGGAGDKDWKAEGEDRYDQTSKVVEGTGHDRRNQGSSASTVAATGPSTNVEDTLLVLLAKLATKRRQANRPEDFSVRMSYVYCIIYGSNALFTQVFCVLSLFRLCFKLSSIKQGRNKDKAKMEQQRLDVSFLLYLFLNLFILIIEL